MVKVGPGDVHQILNRRKFFDQNSMHWNLWQHFSATLGGISIVKCTLTRTNFGDNGIYPNMLMDIGMEEKK